MTGLLIACLAAAFLALAYGISSNQHGLINDALYLAAFALLLQVIRRGLYMRNGEARRNSHGGQPEQAVASEGLLPQGSFNIDDIVFGYETLSTSDVTKLLPSLSADQLAAIEAHERSHRDRKKIVERAAKLRQERAST